PSAGRARAYVAVVWQERHATLPFASVARCAIVASSIHHFARASSRAAAFFLSHPGSSARTPDTARQRTKAVRSVFTALPPNGNGWGRPGAAALVRGRPWDAKRLVGETCYSNVHTTLQPAMQPSVQTKASYPTGLVGRTDFEKSIAEMSA